jgi:dienelactone hydrolase
MSAPRRARITLFPLVTLGSPLLRHTLALLLTLMLSTLLSRSSAAQAYGEPDRNGPGDAGIQSLLAGRAVELEQRFVEDLQPAGAWNARVDALREQYLDMLGLHPLPERTPLKATITGSISGDGFIVDNLHFQSRPGLYVAANLYRPAERAGDERLPAILYVCGHSGMGRDGNKTAFQTHGIWFARHGFICLVVDTLQLGEIAATHHGTYNLGRWWWHSRGYTPAGVECWNGIRALDYLVSREDVDAERLGVTGISGGGAATFWIAAADTRVRAAAPVSGMADLESYVANRVINGHCDCMFMYNHYQWPWTRIAALITPRPLLFVNSDDDAIFPMDANERISNRLERHYSQHAASDRFETVVSVGGHAYRTDIRAAVYRFMNLHLRGDATPITDAEVDENAGRSELPIPPQRLRAFATDADLPADQLNTTIDEHFVPTARMRVPADATPEQYARWQSGLLGALRHVPLRALPESIPPATAVAHPASLHWVLATEPGVECHLEGLPNASLGGEKRLVILLDDPAAPAEVDWYTRHLQSSQAAWKFEPRGMGRGSWTRKNPPNYVERSHALLGSTVDTGRVLDVIAAARFLKATAGEGARVELMGHRGGAILAAYAAALAPSLSDNSARENPTGASSAIDSVKLIAPLATHQDAAAPQFLSVLRICDVPDVLGLIAPRPLVLVDAGDPAAWEDVQAAYRAAGAANEVRFRP